MSRKRVLVAGTTSDYIDLIRTRYPERCLFLTHPGERRRFPQLAPPESEELLCDLSDTETVKKALWKHLDHWHIKPTGIACYDCESLALAAQLAGLLSLPFVSPPAVKNSRNKYLSKVAWQRARIACPRVALGRNLQDARNFLETTGAPVVIKPLTGSGSELVFFCHDLNDCFRAVRKLKGRLAGHPDSRMYAFGVGTDDRENARESFVMEQYVEGEEYSADFLLSGDRAEIIRIALKIPARDQTPGTTAAYLVPAKLPSHLDAHHIGEVFFDAAQTLGIDSGICMVDFILTDNGISLLELTPRPGGDCLPHLIRQSSGLDMLGLALDVAEGVQPHLPEKSAWRPLVGLRLFARKNGLVIRIDADRLRSDQRVLEVMLKRSNGHQVLMPPDDYESRILGHVVFAPNSWERVESECEELAAKLELNMETKLWKTSTP